VYILYSESLNSFYKGQTENIANRLNQHNSLQNTSTKHGVPWSLIWVTQKSSRSEALMLERKLKNLSVDRTIQFILKYEEGIHSKEADDILKSLIARG
jgi:putative endonuclease